MVNLRKIWIRDSWMIQIYSGYQKDLQYIDHYYPLINVLSYHWMLLVLHCRMTICVFDIFFFPQLRRADARDCLVYLIEATLGITRELVVCEFI